MSKRWYLHLGKETTGPFDEAQIVAWERAKVIRPGTMAMPEGEARWIPYRQIPAIAKKSGLQTAFEMLLSLAILGGIFYAFTKCGTDEKDRVPHEAVQLCQDYMRSQANNPSTVSFSMLGQSTDRGAPGGGYRVRLGFTASNAFGLVKEFDSLCKFAPNSLTITEAGAWEKGSR